MKPTIATIWLFIALPISLFAQEPISQTFKASVFRFGGVEAFTNSEGQPTGYYSHYAIANGTVGLKIFDDQLEEVVTVEVSADKNNLLNQVASNGNQLLVSMVAQTFKPSVTYVLLEKDGTELARITRQDAAFLSQGQNFFPRLFPHPNGGFLLVQYFNDKKEKGMLIEYLDEKLSAKWSQRFLADKGNLQLNDLRAEEGKLVVYDAVVRFGNTLTANLRTLDAATGQELYSFPLSNEERTLFPHSFYVQPNGELLATGAYFNGDKIRSKASAGIFVLRLDANGNVLAERLHDRRSLRTVLKTEIFDWFFKVNPEIWLHALVPSENGSLTAIGELYRYGGEITEEVEEAYHRVRLLDFMLLKFTADGQLQEARRVNRQHQEITVPSASMGGLSDGILPEKIGTGPLNRAQALKESGALTYRFHQVLPNGTLLLQYLNYEMNTYYAYATYLADSGYNPFIRTPLTVAKPTLFSALEMMELFAEDQYIFSEEYLVNASARREFDAYENRFRGILPAKPGYQMTYEYAPLSGKVIMNLFPLPVE